MATRTIVNTGEVAAERGKEKDDTFPRLALDLQINHCMHYVYPEVKEKH